MAEKIISNASIPKGSQAATRRRRRGATECTNKTIRSNRTKPHGQQSCSLKGEGDSYLANALEVLTGLEPVRRHPGMYTETAYPNHLAYEVIDNSIDEALADYAKHIKVTLHLDGSLEVTDDGRGIPIDRHPKEKLSGVELLMTTLHSGAKFSNKQYQFSGGLHGVGIAVVNALSKKLVATIKREGYHWMITFSHGKRLAPLKKIGVVDPAETGTSIRFWPEECYFDSPHFVTNKLKHTLKAKAILCPRLTVTYNDEKTKEQIIWYYEGGLSHYLSDSIGALDYLPNNPFAGTVTDERGTIDWALVWAINQASHPVTESYANLIPTPLGGTHVAGLQLGLAESINLFCESHHLLPRGVKLISQDSWKNCLYILSVKLKSPKFSGQTKERLTSQDCKAFVAESIKNALYAWLTQHIIEGEQLAKHIILNAQNRLKAMQPVTRKHTTNGPTLPGKLIDRIVKDIACSELFLLEGDSAGGSARQARYRDFQAIMPLRGKILNTWEVQSTQVLSSQEIHDIAVAIGVDPGSTQLSGLRYGKICILADADSDGNHIATLLAALFLKHFRALVEAGHLFIAMPPLFRIDYKETTYYALDEEEKAAILTRLTNTHKKSASKINIIRFKGLGEMNPLQLRETTMDPATRRLLQLSIHSQDKTDDLFDLLLAKKRAADRKKWLESKGQR